MARKLSSFETVRGAARSLPEVEECLYYGQPALKVRGAMFVCMASHSSAEPESLVVRTDIDTRDLLIAEQPDLYYVTDHYVGYDSVLVRLPRIGREALADLVASAHRYMSRKKTSATTRGRRR